MSAKASKWTSWFASWAAACGFEEDFRERAEQDGLPVICWSLDDLYTRAAAVGAA